MHELSLEDQFTIASFNQQVESMSHEQTKDTLKLVFRSYISQRSTYLQLLKDSWFKSTIAAEENTSEPN